MNFFKNLNGRRRQDFLQSLKPYVSARQRAFSAVITGLNKFGDFPPGDTGSLSVVIIKAVEEVNF